MAIGPVAPVGAQTQSVRTDLGERQRAPGDGATSTQQDRVELSPLARQLSEGEKPRLQLDPEQLRELVKPKAAPARSAAPAVATPAPAPKREAPETAPVRFDVASRTEGSTPAEAPAPKATPGTSVRRGPSSSTSSTKGR